MEAVVSARLTWKKLPKWPSLVQFFVWKLDLCTILSEHHKEGEQIIWWKSEYSLMAMIVSKQILLMDPYFEENWTN